MNKSTLLIFVFLCAWMTNNAQSISKDMDTNKIYWVYPGFTLSPKIHFSNTSSSDITLNWKLISFYMDVGWECGGVCDNRSCKGIDEEGLADGSKTFETFVVKKGEGFDFKLDFNGNEAGVPTKALGTIEIWTGSEAHLTATMVAYKGATSTSNVIMSDYDVAIFPNPASAYVDVVYTPVADVQKITVYDLVGKVVKVYPVTDQYSTRCTFESNMPSGMYILRVADSRDRVLATEKVTRF